MLFDSYDPPSPPTVLLSYGMPLPIGISHILFMTE